MRKIYNIDEKKFRGWYIRTSLPGAMLCYFILNLIVFSNSKWSISVGVVLALVLLALLFVFYMIAWKNWKTAYIAFDDHIIQYYHKVKDGDYEGTREFEERTVTICRVDKFLLKGKTMQLSGDINVVVCKDPDRIKLEYKKISSIKIPLCFKQQNEIISTIQTWWP